MKIKCPAYGFKNEKGAKFCSNCNTPLDKLTGGNGMISNANSHKQPNCNAYDKAEEAVSGAWQKVKEAAKKSDASALKQALRDYSKADDKAAYMAKTIREDRQVPEEYLKEKREEQQKGEEGKTEYIKMKLKEEENKKRQEDIKKIEQTYNSLDTPERVKKYRNSFLWKYGGYIVYIVFFIGFFLNGGVATFYFLNEKWLFGIWALFSIFLLPKAILGFILRLSYLVLHNPLVFINMPQIMWKIFPGTMQKYRSNSL